MRLLMLITVMANAVTGFSPHALSGSSGRLRALEMCVTHSHVQSEG